MTIFLTFHESASFEITYFDPTNSWGVEITPAGTNTGITFYHDERLARALVALYPLKAYCRYYFGTTHLTSKDAALHALSLMQAHGLSAQDAGNEALSWEQTRRRDPQAQAPLPEEHN